MFSPYKMDPVC